MGYSIISNILLLKLEGNRNGGSKFCMPLNCLASRGCKVCDPTPCEGLYPTFALKVSPSFATASWTVAATRHFGSGVENSLRLRAAAKAPKMCVLCLGKRLESQISWENPIASA
jgi:hypothetical protein